MRSPQGVLNLVEVKSQGVTRRARLAPRQKARLMRVACFLSGWEPVELRLALWESQKLRLLPVDALTVE